MKCSICADDRVLFWCSKNGHSVFRCATCQFLFVPIVQAPASEYYGEDYLHNSDGKGGYVNYELDKMPMRRTLADILEKIRSCGAGRRLLDAGTANGYFLDIAREHGFNAEGFDINLSAVLDARRRNRAVWHGDILNNHYSKESFNVITAFDFFEHIPHNRLEELLRIFHDILAPGGTLVVITVNAGSLWARLFGKRWHTLLPPEHVSYFNKKNIVFFLEQNSFRIHEVKTINKTFSLQYLFNILALWQGFTVWKKATHFLENHPILGTISVRPYIGDNMFIVAQKNKN